ncbi:MAG: LamG domain-containing protein [Pseudomonadota bacterium]
MKKKRQICLVIITLIFAFAIWACEGSGGSGDTITLPDGSELHINGTSDDSTGTEVPATQPVPPTETPGAETTPPKTEEALPVSPLLVHYKFDELEGGKVKDLSGKGHDGVLHGDTILSNNANDAMEGSALIFDGDGDYVSISYDDLKPFPLIANPNFTVSIWMKALSFPPADSTALFSNGVNAVSGFDLQFYSNNKVNMVNNPWFSLYSGYIQWGQPAYVDINAATKDYFKIDPNVWYNIIVTYFYDKNLNSGRGGFISRFYINGVLVGENLKEGLTSAPTQRDIIIGCGYKKNTQANPPTEEIGNCFNGIVDEMRIYSKGFTNEDVVGLYNETRIK